MARAIEQEAIDRQHVIAGIFDLPNPITDETNLSHLDVCIDFSLPDAVLSNVRHVAAAGKNMVIGTTGWYDRLPEVEKFARTRRIGIIYAPNFSFGVNLFFEIVEKASELLSPFSQYDPYIHEWHHRHKADSPSGTAHHLSHIIIDKIERKKTAISGDVTGRIPEDHIHISALRAGGAPGSHTIGFDSDIDTITLTHSARDRRGFAQGAVSAAEWIAGKQGLFTMRDLLKTFKL